MGARYDITHRTIYDYTVAVAVSHHTAHLRPRTSPHQHLLSHELVIEPAPAVTSEHIDYFGNAVMFFAMEGPHTKLVVTTRSVVEMTPAESAESTLAASPAWEDVCRSYTDGPIEPGEFVLDSPMVRSSAAYAAYAAASFPAGRGLLDAVADFTRRIHDDFTFDTEATNVATPLEDVFRTRRGVCQDFAHVEIACLRLMGLAARYVSGYLQTTAPAGQPRLVGADASHAWVAVHCPEIGWIDADPTNNLMPATSHVTLAWGRDYSDVSPIRGVILGGGDHRWRVAVDVVEEPGGSDAPSSTRADTPSP